MLKLTAEYTGVGFFLTLPGGVAGRAYGPSELDRTDPWLAHFEGLIGATADFRVAVAPNGYPVIFRPEEGGYFAELPAGTPGRRLFVSYRRTALEEFCRASSRLVDRGGRHTAQEVAEYVASVSPTQPGGAA